MSKLLFVVAVVLIGLVAVGAAYMACTDPQSAIDTTIEWAQLAPLPHSARNVEVDVKGSMFTREFVITFDAPAADIKRWIAASPGPSSATITVAGAITTYAITPGGGAQFAEVKVDAELNRVVVRTYWS